MFDFRVRLMEERDFEAVNKMREAHGWNIVSKDFFDFYQKSGSSFVAEAKGEVVGFVFSQTIKFMHREKQMMWVEYIGVLKGYQGRGIGQTLLKKVVDYVKQHSIPRIEATINPDNLSSIRLAEKTGFKVRDWKRAIYSIENSS